MADADDDPGPVWQHLPIADPTTPSRTPLAPGDRGHIAGESIAWRFRPHLRGLTSTRPSRFALGLTLNLAVGLTALGAYAAGGSDWADSEGLTAAVYAFALALVFSMVQAVVLVLVAAKPRTGNAWPRVVLTGTAIGTVLGLLAMSTATGDSVLGKSAAAVAGVVAWALSIVWCLAPLVAAGEHVSGPSALRRGRVRLRGYGLDALWVTLLLEIAGGTVLAAFAFALPGSPRWDSVEVRIVAVLVGAVSATLWMVWVGDLDRRIGLGAADPAEPWTV